MNSESLRAVLRGRCVAVLYLNFGPYHVARLRAIAAALRACDCRLVGIELSATQNRYLWRVARRDEEFEWKTLFAGQAVEAIPARAQRRAIRETLDACRPAAVAIAGWSQPVMRAALTWCRWSGTTAVLCADSARNTRQIEGRHLGRRWWLELLKRWLVRGFRAGHVAGEASREYISSLGVPRERIFLKYDVVDNEYFTSVAAEVRRDRAHWRRQLDVPERFFFYPARVIDLKNHLRLLQAYRRYLQRAGQHPWELIFVGSGEADPGVDAQLAEMNCPLVNRRKFAQIEEIARYYGLASALVFPSLSETWGLIVNEAAAAGLPILLSTGCGSVEHLLEEGVNGFALDPFNVEQMADRLTRMASLSDEELAQMGAASKRIIDGWRPEDHAAELLNAIAAGAAARR